MRKSHRLEVPVSYKNMSQCFCYCDEMIYEKLRRICGILAEIGEKIPDGSFFSRTRQSGADSVITEVTLLFPERHTSPSICFTAGSVLSGLSIDVLRTICRNVV